MLIRGSWIIILVLQLVPLSLHKKAITTVEQLHTKAVTRVVGEDGLLTCIVRHQGDNTVIWKKDQKGKNSIRVLTANSAVITSDKRISVLHENDGEVYVLLIKNLTTKDAGFYVCEVNSDPPIRTFQQLKVVKESAVEIDDEVTANPNVPEAASIHTGLVAPAAEAYWANPLDSLIHNFTQCCADKKVSNTCLGFCDVTNILGGVAGNPSQCESDFPAIAECMADGRNHVPCCEAAGIPEVCQDLCRGEYNVQTDLLKTHFSCAEHTTATLTCIAIGIESLPGSPEDLSVTAVNDTTLKIRWNPPHTPPGLNHKYFVNVTYHQLLIPVYSVTVNSTAAKQFYPSQSQIYEVPINTTTLVVSSLEVFSLYEVYMWTEGKNGGKSLPTYKEMVVTHVKGGEYESREAPPPQLPDIKSCCIKNNVTHAKCVDDFCDPLRMSSASVTDLMICAPWDTQIFSCLADGRDHTPCCSRKSIPPICQELCSGRVTDISYKYFRCLSYMDELSSCLLDGYNVLPSAPKNLRFSNVETNFGILHWDKPDEHADSVQQYVVSYQEMGRNMGQRKELFNAESPFILEHLNSSSSYEVYVMAMNEYGVGEESSRIVFRTASRTLADLQEDTGSYNQTKCCISAGVKKSCQKLCTYNAKFSDLLSLHSTCQEDLSKILRCGVGGRDHLPCCTQRGVPRQCQPLCQAVNQLSSGTDYSACLPYIGQVYMCLEEGTASLPESPSYLRAARVTNDTVTLMWHVENRAEIDQYEIYYRKVLNNSDNSNIFKSDKQMNTTSIIANVNDLETNMFYTFYVVARNSYGTSLPTSILKVNVSDASWIGNSITSAASPPHLLEVGAKSALWLDITWNPPVIAHPEDMLSYRLFFREVSQDETAKADNKFNQIDTETTAIRLINLRPNTQYSMYAVTVSRKADENTNRTSDPSETLIAWTDPALPAFVEAPILEPSGAVNEGDNMTIICAATGSPTPTITLYVDGHPLFSNTSRRIVTTIHNVKRHMGYISCLADNGYGTPMQTTRNIVINRTPSIEAKMKFEGIIGDDLTIECKADALPRPSIQLFRDKAMRNMLMSNGRTEINFSQTDDETKYMLSATIKNISVNDAGFYYCKAKNHLGEKVAPISVVVPQEIRKTIDVRTCCANQNVSADCQDICQFSIDFDDLLRKPQCFLEFSKIMFCASDGSDHRHCCKMAEVPNKCINWCRGQPSDDEILCAAEHSSTILQCFHENQDDLPGPPQKVKVQLTSNHSAVVTWDVPAKNADKVELYRVYYREQGTRESIINDTPKRSFTLDSLIPGKLYEVVLKSGNAKGTSHLTPPIVFATNNHVLIETSFYRAETNLTAIIVFLVVFILAATVTVIIFVKKRNMCSAFRRKNSAMSVYFENPFMNIQEVQNPTVTTS